MPVAFALKPAFRAALEVDALGPVLVVERVVDELEVVVALRLRKLLLELLFGVCLVELIAVKLGHEKRRAWNEQDSALLKSTDGNGNGCVLAVSFTDLTGPAIHAETWLARLIWTTIRPESATEHRFYPVLSKHRHQLRAQGEDGGQAFRVSLPNFEIWKCGGNSPISVFQ